MRNLESRAQIPHALSAQLWMVAALGLALCKNCLCSSTWGGGQHVQACAQSPVELVREDQLGSAGWACDEEVPANRDFCPLGGQPGRSQLDEGRGRIFCMEVTPHREEPHQGLFLKGLRGVSRGCYRSYRSATWGSCRIQSWSVPYPRPGLARGSPCGQNWKVGERSHLSVWFWWSVLGAH